MACSRHSCCKLSHLVPLLCLLLLVVGTPLWMVHSYAAANSTRDALAAASFSTSLADYAMGVVGVVRLVVLVLALVTGAVALGLTLLKISRHAAARHTGGASRSSSSSSSLGGGTADGLTTSLVWLLMLGAVALLALFTTWFLTSLAADMLLNTATEYSNNAEKAVGRAVSSANMLVDQLRDIQLRALDAAPADVQASQWYRDFKMGIQNFNQTVSLAAGTPSAAACKPGCVSLDFLAGLAGLDSTCLCIQNTITAVQQSLQSTKQATLLCLVGVLLSYLAASWLIICFTASCVNARRDRREHRRLAKSSSCGGAPWGNGKAGSGGSGRLPPGTDAAIDIRTDSHVGIKAPAPAAQQRVAHHAVAYAATADVAADVAPRDTNRTQRLPFV